MANSDIVRYLDEGLKKGFSIDVLKAQLIDAGFLEEDIDDAERFVSPSEFLPGKKVSFDNEKKEKKEPTTFIKILSVLYYISAGLGVIQALYVIFSGSSVAAMFNIPMINTLFIGFAVLIIMFSLLSFFIARGLWNLKNWTRVFLLVCFWISAVIGVIGMFATIFLTGPIGLVMIVPLMISGLFIWYFQYNKEVVALFKQN